MKKCRIFRKAMLALILILALFLTAVCSADENRSGNPHTASWLDEDMIRTIESLRRVDKDGYLYEMTCFEDYRNNGIIDRINAKNIPGCSAFVAYNADGDFVSCRNYDCRHRVLNPDGSKTDEYTGADVLLHCAPKGGYRSIAMADAHAIFNDNSEMKAGALDNGTMDISDLALIPYYSMDGLNEKGLFACIHTLDLREDETPLHQNEPGKPLITHTEFIRILLDDCATVEEAVARAEDFNFYVYDNLGVHIFVSDATGRSAILEWRYGKLTVTDTDAATNFYLTYDDIREGALKLENTYIKYHYGYGHGYERFNGIVSALQRYRDKETGRVTMPQAKMKSILMAAAQDMAYEKTTQTQYSAIYNNIKGTLTLWSFQNYDREYHFSIDPQTSDAA